jgi:hypothetical protein
MKPKIVRVEDGPDLPVSICTVSGHNSLEVTSIQLVITVLTVCRGVAYTNIRGVHNNLVKHRLRLGVTPRAG